MLQPQALSGVPPISLTHLAAPPCLPCMKACIWSPVLPVALSRIRFQRPFLRAAHLREEWGPLGSSQQAAGSCKDLPGVRAPVRVREPCLSHTLGWGAQPPQSTAVGCRHFKLAVYMQAGGPVPGPLCPARAGPHAFFPPTPPASRLWLLLTSSHVLPAPKHPCHQVSTCGGSAPITGLREGGT